LEFPTEVIRELETINEEMTENDAKDRQDLRDLPTITIDPVSAKDYDDAIGYIATDSNIKLYVHIADVSHYVKPELKLFEEAVKRGNSYYFPKMVIPMLPEKLSNKVCSLRPDEDKLTMTVETIFDSDFNIIRQKAYQSIIKSDARFSYDEIDDLFEGKKNEIKPELAEMLRNMLALSRELDKKRIKRGYIKLNLPETEFIFNDEGIVIDLKRSNETESHVLIENFMLLANEFVAQKLSDKPTLYRIHEYPDEEKILSLQEILSNYKLTLTDLNDLHHSLQKVLAEMKEENYHRVFDKIILRSFRKARYSTENPGHFGLAMDTYTHFTSPIRRICDLIVHLQLKDRLTGKPDRFSRGELENYAGKASECEKIADESEREVEIKNKLLFMKKQIGEEFTGIIVGVQPSSLLVELDSLPVSGRVELSTLKDDYYEYFEKHQEIVGKRYGKIYKLTDPVRVMISKIDDDIYLNILKNK
ncbi:MAG: VacB/RNase II family 3'-5' exoribonuclease, partial [Candidatus Cloacimonetes bacterium]|nr:VacB/RNase II family 3'-5' exoribonuclease [Candidatus Cloacimonadota bacterium]